MTSQLGARPGDVVTAILRIDDVEPVPVEIIDADGEVVATAVTNVFGPNSTSADHVHQVSFAGLDEGEGYRVAGCGQMSSPFSVSEDIFDEVVRKTLLYFYANRFGEPVDAALVPDAQWARRTAFPEEKASCFSGEDMKGQDWGGCAHTLDVTGGWADAGDYGKYVVNGGITVWTLQFAAERLRSGRPGNPEEWGDGGFAVPEAGNGASDILDEARHGLEFLMAMQVPEGARVEVAEGMQELEDGKPLRTRIIDAGGLAHHKVHGASWHAFPLRPEEAGGTRYLYPPSTAASLNLAAAAAQGARLWRGIDDAFADRALASATRAYDAARRHPDLLAHSNFDGGGAYGDSNLSDEFLWAATELFLTTGLPQYAADIAEGQAGIAGSPLFNGESADISWNSVALLPVLSMVFAPAELERDTQEAITARLVQVADSYLADRSAEGYGFPFAADDYVWGSSGAIANRGMVLTVARDVTGDQRYADAARDVMDYLLGRNALGISYIAGFGERAMKTPHHRFWAAGVDPAYPIALPGAVSGGANGRLDSGPVATKMKGTCAPQRCWVDDADAYALNEVAINWNAPVFWLALSLAAE